MRRTETTRREFVGVGAAVGGALLAGCTSGSDDNGTEDSSGNGDSSDAASAASTDDTSADESYTVSIEPMGAVEFDEPPERWVALLPSYADMAFALGGGETLGIQGHERFATEAYDELPGVEYDESGIRDLNQQGIDKELFYEMDADVHFVEPNQLIHWYDWSESDVDEIADNVGPFFGNFGRRRSDEWHEYRYYDLYEAFDLMADVFRERERYEAFVELHESMLETIDERLPPADERPNAMLVYPADSPPTEFYPYRFDDGGISTKQWRDLELTDALGGEEVGHYAGDGGTIDMETVLEVDPEVLLVRGQEGASESEFREAIIEPMREDPVASEVQAVQDEAVYNAGYLDQGPIINFYQTERAAKDIYPDAFEDVTLFDRERVADIVTGEF